MPPPGFEPQALCIIFVASIKYYRLDEMLPQVACSEGVKVAKRDKSINNRPISSISR
jgi:hypothetical protein